MANRDTTLAFDQLSAGRLFWLICFSICVSALIALHHFNLAKPSIFIAILDGGGRDAKAIVLGAAWLIVAFFALASIYPALAISRIEFDKGKAQFIWRRGFLLVPLPSVKVSFADIEKLYVTDDTETTVINNGQFLRIRRYHFKTVNLKVKGRSTPLFLWSVNKNESFGPGRSPDSIGKRLGWKNMGGAWAPKDNN